MQVKDISKSLNDSDLEFEETTHHFQVRKVLERLEQKKALRRIYMPYKKEELKTKQLDYESNDEITEKFMEHFAEDIQRVNNGELKPKRFKSKIGRKQFELLAKVFETGYRSCQQGKGKIILCQSKQEGKRSFFKRVVEEPYVTMGNELIENMVMRAERKTAREERRTEILAKTKNILGMDVIEAGKFVLQRMRKRKQNGIKKTEAISIMKSSNTIGLSGRVNEGR